MKIKFKHQSYQDDAVNSIVKCFEGQPIGSRRDLLARYKTIEGTGLFREEKMIELIYYDLLNHAEAFLFAFVRLEFHPNALPEL